MRRVFKLVAVYFLFCGLMISVACGKKKKNQVSIEEPNAVHELEEKVPISTYSADESDKGFQALNEGGLKVSYYLDSKGDRIKNTWLKDENDTYFFDADGKMVIGIKEIDGKEYGFDINGKLKNDDFDYLLRHYIVDSDKSIKKSISLEAFRFQNNSEKPINDIIDKQDATNNDTDIYYYGMEDEQIASVNDIINTFYDNYIEGTIDKDSNDWKFKREIAIIMYLVDNMEYDYENYHNNSIPAIDHTPYGALVNKKAVCDGFSEAFALLCKRCEIPVIKVSSQTHAWNLVQLDDGDWYHVDSTWNICSGNYAEYTNFTEEQCEILQYHGNNYGKSTSYNDIKFGNKYLAKDVFEYLKSTYGVIDLSYDDLRLLSESNRVDIDGKLLYTGGHVNRYPENSCLYYYLDGTTLHYSSRLPSEGYIIYGGAYETETSSWFLNNRFLKDVVTRVVIDDEIEAMDSYAYDLFVGYKLLREINGFDRINTSNLTDFKLFTDCESLQEIDLSKTNTANAKSMASMFRGCKNLNEIDLRSFNTEKVINMSEMFNGCEKLKKINLSSLDTSKVENFSRMFNKCLSLEYIDISNFVTSNVKDFSFMFNECVELKEIDVTNFDTSNATSIRGMFSECKKIVAIDLGNFRINDGVNCETLLMNCDNLKKMNISDSLARYINNSGISGNWKSTSNNKLYTYKENNYMMTTIPPKGGEYVKVEGVYKKSGTKMVKVGEIIDTSNNVYWYMDNNTLHLAGEKPQHPNWNSNQVQTKSTSITSIPWYVYRDDIYKVVIDDEIKLKECVDLLGNLPYLEVIEGLEKLDTKDVRLFGGMFEGDTSLKEIDVSHFDTSNAYSFGCMFARCINLEKVNVSKFHFDTVKVTNAMFYNCNNLNSIGIKEIKLSKDCVCEQMFDGCDNLGRVSVIQ